ncbi:hypothetical protein KIPB_010565, partial [Kipferlia bialata]
HIEYDCAALPASKPTSVPSYARPMLKACTVPLSSIRDDDAAEALKLRESGHVAPKPTKEDKEKRRPLNAGTVRRQLLTRAAESGAALSCCSRKVASVVYSPDTPLLWVDERERETETKPTESKAEGEAEGEGEREKEPEGEELPGGDTGEEAWRILPYALGHPSTDHSCGGAVLRKIAHNTPAITRILNTKTVQQKTQYYQTHRATDAQGPGWV